MRKILFLSLFLSLCQFSKAQMFFDFGAKAGFGGTWLFNKIMMNDNKIKYGLNPSFAFGGKVSVNFNESYAVSGEFIYSNLVSQTYKFSNNLSSEVQRKITFNIYDVPVLFRKNGESGDFFEIGPQFSFVQKVKDETGTDVAENFKPTYANVLLGFGHYLFGVNSFYGTLGLRFTFNPTDIITAAGGKGQTNFYPLKSSEYASNYTAYAATIPITAMLMMEFNLDFGYFAKSKCKRRAFIMF
ncbi:MAG: outer membrane beta-barrel protein [Flavobacteriales bacterium]